MKSYHSYNSGVGQRRRSEFTSTVSSTEIFGNRYRGVPELVMTAIEHWQTDRW